MDLASPGHLMRASNFSPVLKPVLRAYALGYLTTTGPRILSFIRVLRRKDLTNEDKLRYLARILLGALQWNRFPTACAVLVGGSTALPLLINKAIAAVFNFRGPTRKVVLAVKLSRLFRVIAIFISSWLSFGLLNNYYYYSCPSRSASRPGLISDEAPSGTRKSDTSKLTSRDDDNTSLGASHAPNLAGRTLDLTLFTMIRALDVLACVSWSGWKRHRKSSSLKPLSRMETMMPALYDTGLFVASSAVVMWTWMYAPESLPFSYERWISGVAQIDHRLIEALRTARKGLWRYGKPNGSQVVLETMCEDYGWPTEWGDPSKTVPFPCEIVHMGRTRSCEVHAIWRFGKCFKYALATHLPIQLALRSRSPSVKSYIGGVKSSLRSSTFLGLFVALFYYSVCLARTRLGPKVFSPERVSPMMWDSGLCVASGCAMCGWSILVENANRRPEIALFVAPRAVATCLPRSYNREHLWKEQLAFSLSTTVTLACFYSDPKKVRGVFGKVLGQIFGKR